MILHVLGSPFPSASIDSSQQFHLSSMGVELILFRVGRTTTMQIGHTNSNLFGDDVTTVD
jgi:hypothetical protein